MTSTVLTKYYVVMTNNLDKTEYQKPVDDVRYSKSKKNVVIVVLIVLLVVTPLVYWLVYRPYDIKKDCNNFAQDEALQTSSYEGGSSYINTEKYNNAYNYCLRVKGL